MDAKVNKPFTDLEKGGVYMPGDTFSGTASRIDGLVEKGFLRKPKQEPSKRGPKTK